MQATKKTTHTTTSQDLDVINKCLVARDLERAGDYEQARAALEGVWSVVGEAPIVDNFPLEVQAEVLLRAGALSGWIGSAQQITGAQEFAKDLLTQSIRLFQVLDNPNKISEAQTDLALCYWREGAYPESRVLFEQSLANANSPESRLRALTNSTVVELSSGHPQRALEILNDAASLAESCTDPAARGRYHIQRALTLRKVGGDSPEFLDKALVEYSACSFYFELAGHERYRARVENNIGFILLQLSRHEDAMEHLNRARDIFLSLKDVGSVAQVNETRARVLNAQQKYSEAARTAAMAVKTLRTGGEQSLLAEALITYATALARTGKDRPARAAFQQAADVTDTAGDRYSAGRAYLVMIEELQSSLAPGETIKLYREADERLDQTNDPTIIGLLRRCAQLAIDASLKTTVNGQEDVTGGLETQVLRFESHLIQQALDQANGSITHAARLLSLTHQGLAYILDTRHKSLVELRRPRRTRRRSIIRK
jgi:tetratricopeptide (TPR) repeat protein